jgi:hypothetical protein
MGCLQKLPQNNKKPLLQILPKNQKGASFFVKHFFANDFYLPDKTRLY